MIVCDRTRRPPTPLCLRPSSLQASFRCMQPASAPWAHAWLLPPSASLLAVNVCGGFQKDVHHWPRTPQMAGILSHDLGSVVFAGSEDHFHSAIGPTSAALGYMWQLCASHDRRSRRPVPEPIAQLPRRLLQCDREFAIFDWVPYLEYRVSNNFRRRLVVANNSSRGNFRSRLVVANNSSRG